MRFPADRVLRPEPAEQAPRPGHPIYEFLGFVPLERRVPAMTPGGYTGNPRASRARSRARMLPLWERITQKYLMPREAE